MTETSQGKPGTVVAGSGEVPELGPRTRWRHRDRKLWVLVAVGALAAAAAVTAVTALFAGSPNDPPPALAALTGALAKTSGESYSFTLVSTVKYTGNEVNSDVVSGAFDPRDELGTELLTENAAQPSGPPQRAQMRFIGNYVYTRVSPGSGPKGIGKPWNKALLPPAGANVLPAGGLYSFATDQPTSPNELLTVLRSTATVNDTGSVSGPGWNGNRYTFTSRLSPQWSVSGTAYVDRQGQIRRLMTTTTQSNGTTTVRDFTFSGFGAPVPVTAPSADQVWYTNHAYWGFYF